MNRKSIYYLSGFIYFSLSFFLFGCKSSNPSDVKKSFPILGQNNIIVENLYIEYFNLGNAYFDIERYGDAIKYYTKAADDVKLKKACDYKIAQCYAFTADWERALDSYNQLLASDNENQVLKANIAYIYAMKGDYENARLCYDELLDVQPENLTYIENYLAILLSSPDMFAKNKDVFEGMFESLKSEYPKNEHIESFQLKYDEYMKDYVEEEKSEPLEEKEGDNTEKKDGTENKESGSGEDSLKESDSDKGKVPDENKLSGESK